VGGRFLGLVGIAFLAADLKVVKMSRVHESQTSLMPRGQEVGQRMICVAELSTADLGWSHGSQRLQLASVADGKLYFQEPDCLSGLY
jgi:hypothetical protein